MVEFLYKYMTAERVLSCLPKIGDGALRATQPAALNDLFECGVASGRVGLDRQMDDMELAEVLSSLSVT